MNGSHHVIILFKGIMIIIIFDVSLVTVKTINVDDYFRRSVVNTVLELKFRSKCHSMSSSSIKSCIEVVCSTSILRCHLKSVTYISVSILRQVVEVVGAAPTDRPSTSPGGALFTHKTTYRCYVSE